MTAVPSTPVTYNRPQATGLSQKLEDPGIGRANIAATAEAPNGTAGWAEKHEDEVCLETASSIMLGLVLILTEQTVIQQHILFFDTDGDGVIWPRDTYKAFRDLGFNIPFSLITIIINLAFSYPTRMAHTYVPDPFFRIYIDSIHKAKVISLC